MSNILLGEGCSANFLTTMWPSQTTPGMRGSLVEATISYSTFEYFT
jgi:hypothetical protein